jgi:hypothetical protein
MPTARPRTSWQSSSQPVIGPARRKKFQRGVIHWEGANRDSAPVDIPAHLRRMQDDWLTDPKRGFSLGYGYSVVSDTSHPLDGEAFEVRGSDLNMASNPGVKWNAQGGSPSGNSNDWTGSILLIGSNRQGATPKAAATVRRLLSEWHTEAGTTLIRPLAHSTFDYTQCCGPHYTADLAAGLFDPAGQPTVPPFRPIPGVPDMLRTTALDNTPLPFRNSDTRAFGGLGMAPNTPLRFGLNPAKFPANTVAVAMNVAVVGPQAPGFVTVWTAGAKPVASMINFPGRMVDAEGRPVEGASSAFNGSTVVGIQGLHWMIETTQRAHLVCDITGYWTT